jgi:NADH-quinone oxidoreductase subunit L
MERGHHALAHHNEHEEHEGKEEVFDPGDMRNMGGLRKRMPVTFWVYLAGTLALAGIFPFAGFWSKDEILLDAARNFPAVYWLLTIAAFLTAFYMGRQVWMVFFGEPRHAAAAHAVESPRVVTVPLTVLAGLSVLGGLLNFPGLNSLSAWLGHTIEAAEHATAVASWLQVSWGGLNPFVALISTVLALAAIYFSWLIYGRRPLETGQIDPLKKALGPVFTVFERKYWVDELYGAVIVNRYVDVARFLADVIDTRFWHDWFHDTVIAGTYQWLARTVLSLRIDTQGIDAFFNWLGTLTKQVSAALRKLQNGFVRSYALAVLLGVVVIVGYLILK